MPPTEGTKERIVFMGSPDFAVPALRALAQQYNIVSVVTQPDRPSGRGRSLNEPPVKQAALALGLPVWQPENLRDPDAMAYLAGLAPDVAVVVAYGEILRPRVLALAPKGFLNLHASLLPLYRGASPVSAAILAGEDITGVTLMYLDKGMDTGPIIAQATAEIEPDDTRGTLEAKLADIGAWLLVQALPHWLAGEMRLQQQDGSMATVTKPLLRQDGLINWHKPAMAIERLCRAMDPWPGAYTYWQGKNIKIWRGQVIPGEASLPPGSVILREGQVCVATGDGWLRLLTLQPEGRSRMTPEDFARGRPQFLGCHFDDTADR